MTVSQESRLVTVKLTANFERNLEEIERFLIEAKAPEAFDTLLDALTDVVIPNLERFPSMGRTFLSRPVRSVEASNGLDILHEKLATIGGDADIREYVLSDHLILYAYVGSVIHLLAIRHHRQLSFDFLHLWTSS